MEMIYALNMLLPEFLTRILSFRWLRWCEKALSRLKSSTTLNATAFTKIGQRHRGQHADLTHGHCQQRPKRHRANVRRSLSRKSMTMKFVDVSARMEVNASSDLKGRNIFRWVIEGLLNRHRKSSKLYPFPFTDAYKAMNAFSRIACMELTLLKAVALTKMKRSTKAFKKQGREGNRDEKLSISPP